MNYSSKSAVEYDLKNHYQLRDRYIRELNARSVYCGSNIKQVKSIDGVKYYSIKHHSNKSYTYVGKDDNKDIQGIREYKFFEQAISAIESNIAVMEDFLVIYRNTRAENINELLGRVYRLPRTDTILLSESEASNWLKVNNSIKSNFPVFDEAGLKVRAFDGTMMRSRAEAIHYEAFYIYNIPAIFELPYVIGTETYRPDFTILYVYTMSPIMWEHLGNWFHNNIHKRNQYRTESVYRWDEYAKIGFLPETNLMLSFGAIDNYLDIQSLFRKISAFAVPPPSDETISMLKRC